MSTVASPSWTIHARAALASAGHRTSTPREEVIEAIAALGCSVTAREIAELLRERGSGVGLASIYRTLDLLDRLRLVQRFDVGEGVARYEPSHPGGEHHHHVVCEACGKRDAFADPELEQLIDALGDRLGYTIAGHDVVLRGACPDCADA